MDRGLYQAEHTEFRASVRTFVEREVEPNLAAWDEQRSTGREVWLAAGRQGIIGLPGPPDCGGAGVTDFRFRNVVIEELARVGAASLQSSFSLQDDILIPYLADLADPDQRQRWLAPMCIGEAIAAIAMTEPGTGSDLRAIQTRAEPRPGGWLLNGAKTFISSGIQADLVVVVARTDPAGGRDGFSLLVVERDTEGFSRGRKLDKLGLPAQDTAELFFDDVFVPEENLLGQVGQGLTHLRHHLPLERFAIAAMAMAAADAALAWTLDYVRERTAFGQRIADFQHSQFTLAEIAIELDVARAYIDRCIEALNADRLSEVDAAKAKAWATGLQVRTVDRLLQLWGGYGYMLEYPIARAYRDARVQPIYGGTNEIMKLIIARDLIGRPAAAEQSSPRRGRPL